MSPLYVVLVHHPVLDKRGDIVASAVTNMDLHDIARTGKTYGVSGLFIATPTPALRRLSEKIIQHWETGYGAEYNETRKEALAIVHTVPDLDATLLEIERRTGEMPVVVATSAREGERRVRFPELRRRLATDPRPHLLVLGTGWGLAPAVLDRADVILEPIRGVAEYNHLPVRATAAILLDRLVGREEG